ncbi:MAG: hypothetical protein ABEJ36_03490 [Candidatus Nanosalina sp.]
MEFLDGSTQYEFYPSRYEEAELGELDFSVETIEEKTEMKKAVSGTGSCLIDHDGCVMDKYLESFADSDIVNFYRIEGGGYARSIELETSEGDALAVDAVKTPEDFDSSVYRAGVNSIFRHAEAMNKDLVLGGPEFFRENWTRPIDLTYDEGILTPAHEVFFDRALTEEELQIHQQQKPYFKVEQWDENEEYFVRYL